MTWAKLDDAFWANPKVIAVGNEAAGVYARGLAYCCAQLTDGFIPDEVATFIVGRSRKALRRLVENGLWKTVSGGYQVPDFLEFNPSRTEVREKRERDAERQRRFRESHRDTHRDTHRDSRRDSAASNGAPSRPVPLEESDDSSRSRNGTDEVRLIFDAWVEATKRDAARTKLTDKRRRVIRKALADYSLEDLVAAVRGWKHSPHHRGENDRDTVYNDLELLLRDAQHIEKFRDLELAKGTKANPLDSFTREAA